MPNYPDEHGQTGNPRIDPANVWEVAAHVGWDHDAACVVIVNDDGGYYVMDAREARGLAGMIMVASAQAEADRTTIQWLKERFGFDEDAARSALMDFCHYRSEAVKTQNAKEKTVLTSNLNADASLDDVCFCGHSLGQHSPISRECDYCECEVFRRRV